MRRRAAIATLVLLVGVVLVARRCRRRAPAPLDEPPRRPVAALPAAEPRFVSVRWTLAAPPDERPELAIRCHQDDALVLDRVDAQETPTQVFLTALARRQPRGSEEPPRSDAEATVVLTRPLGTRELIPAPVDAEPDAPPLYP
jgi:hypothetical protein